MEKMEKNNFWSRKNITVTGGCGFIGSKLIKKLKALDAKKILSVDDYSSGSKKNEIEGVEYLHAHTRDITVNHLRDTDILFHLGEYSRVEASFAEYRTVLASNVQGSANIFYLWRELDFKLIYAGSSTKYGDGGLGRAQSPYALSKSHNSEIVKNYIDWFSLKGAITYFYNVYGDGEISDGSYATVVGIFLRKFFNNEPLPVVMPGIQRRNFTHIDDIISGLLLVAELGQGDEYGIGSKESYSILELAKMISDNIIYADPRPGNRLDASVITDKIEALGWRPTRNLPDYVKSKCIQSK